MNISNDVVSGGQTPFRPMHRHHDAQIVSLGRHMTERIVRSHSVGAKLLVPGMTTAGATLTRINP
jgi:hypothetical protein